MSGYNSAELNALAEAWNSYLIDRSDPTYTNSYTKDKKYTRINFDYNIIAQERGLTIRTEKSTKQKIRRLRLWFTFMEKYELEVKDKFDNQSFYELNKATKKQLIQDFPSQEICEVSLETTKMFQNLVKDQVDPSIATHSANKFKRRSDRVENGMILPTAHNRDVIDLSSTVNDNGDKFEAGEGLNRRESVMEKAFTADEMRQLFQNETIEPLPKRIKPTTSSCSRDNQFNLTRNDLKIEEGESSQKDQLEYLIQRVRESTEEALEKQTDLLLSKLEQNIETTILNVLSKVFNTTTDSNK